MAIFTGELGLQFVTHLANHYTVPDLVRLAQFAGDKGFKQIWVNDNIRYRGQLVVLTAIAARVPIQLGTAIMVPYFHNPLDVADCLAALAELCEGREIGVGIARGDLGQSPQHVQSLKPLAMVSQTAVSAQRAWRRGSCLSGLPVAAGVLSSQSERKIPPCLQTQSSVQVLRRRQRSAVAAHVRPSDGWVDQLRHLHSDAQSGPAAGNAGDCGSSGQRVGAQQASAKSLRAERFDLTRP